MAGGRREVLREGGVSRYGYSGILHHRYFGSAPRRAGQQNTTERFCKCTCSVAPLQSGPPELH